MISARLLCSIGLGMTWFIPVTKAFAGTETTYSPYVARNIPDHVYWGDTHLHTKLSVDAYNFVNAGDFTSNRLEPEDAYRFARGEAVRAHNGMLVRLRRPLDFLVIADHSENLGVMVGVEKKDPLLFKSERSSWLMNLYEEIKTAVRSSLEKAARLIAQLARESVLDDTKFNSAVDAPEFNRSQWHGVTARADRFNNRGHFTAFVGYEWTAQVVDKVAHIHRVVIFKDGSDVADKVIPFTAFDSVNPEDLWRWMADYEKRTGGELLAIPHNGNLSMGNQFALQDQQGRRFSRTYATMRSKWEPLYEITQTKGTSETHPLLSPTDEFSNFELWNVFSRPETLRYEYARSALKLGLGEQARLGVNPFKYGFIGSTDSHTGISAIDEDNYWGPKSNVEPGPGRLAAPNAGGAKTLGWQASASGFTAVWATENTREALFAAMKRRETYATTGPRIVVRFFGGWDYSKGDALKPDLAQIGYRNGVPMGGDLANAPAGKAPSFLIRAVKDPDGANLDRVQMVKGWRSKDGRLHERVYNVALSNGRLEGPDGKVPPVGATVNVRDASYTNRIGAPELAIVWTDPSFRRDELAFYYLRVIEIPTPRWTAYDVKFFGLKKISSDIPMVIQERAFTSPIWYTP